MFPGDMSLNEIERAGVLAQRAFRVGLFVGAVLGLFVGVVAGGCFAIWRFVPKHADYTFDCRGEGPACVRFVSDR